MHGKSPHGSVRERTLTKSASSNALSKQEKANAAHQKRNHTNPVVVMSRLPQNKNAQRNNGHSRSRNRELLEDGLEDVGDEEEDDQDIAEDDNSCDNNNAEAFDEDIMEIHGNSNNNSAHATMGDSKEGLFVDSQKSSGLIKRPERQDTLILQRPSPKQNSSMSGGSPLTKSSTTASPSSLSKSSAAKSSHTDVGSWMSSSSPNLSGSSSPAAPTSVTSMSLSSQKSKGSPTHHGSSKSASSKQLQRQLSKSSISSKPSPLSKHSPMNTPGGSAPSTPMSEERGPKLGEGRQLTTTTPSPTTPSTSSTTISPQGVIVTNTTLTNYKTMQKEKNVPCKGKILMQPNM